MIEQTRKKIEGEKTDSMSTTVNDAECTDLTPSVDMEEGGGKKDDKNDRIAEEKYDNYEKK